jgi:hypothetical protein
MSLVLGPNPAAARNRNVVIATPDWGDAATWAASLTPEAGSSVANLTTRQPSQVAGFDVSGGAVTLTGTCAAAAALDVVAVVLANATTAATIAVGVGDNATEATGTGAYDASGHARHGTLTGGAVFGAGKYDGGLWLSNPDPNVLGQYLRRSGLIDTGLAWTYMAWVKPVGITGVTLWSHDLRVLATTGAGKLTYDTVTASSPLIAGVWQHVAVTQENDGTLTLYLDGEAIGSGTVTPTDAETGVLHWGTHQGTGLGFTGALDDCRYYTGTLSGAEIQAQMQSETPTVTANLVLQYKCNGYQTGALPFASPNLATYARRNSFLFLPYRMTNQLVVITIADPTNPLPLRIGRLVLGQAWQPTWNFNVNYQFTARDESKKTTTPSGQTLTDARPVIHGFDFQLEHVPRLEMLANGYELRRTLGTSRECLVCLDPEESDHLESHLCYGQLTDLGALSPPYYNGWQMRWSVEVLL